MSDSLYQPSSGAIKCSEQTGQCEHLDVNGDCEMIFEPPCLWGVPSETPSQAPESPVEAR